ncbi:MAG: hypothetical protein IPF70_05370 [Saprospiraceae bacterium]|nr:hypothetical protein [Saprospiraceae bacterium]
MFAKGSGQVDDQGSKYENIDDRKEHPPGVGFFATYDARQFVQIETGYQAFPCIYACFGKYEVHAGAKNDISYE